MESTKLIFAGMAITMLVAMCYSLFFMVIVYLLHSLTKLPDLDYSSMLVDHVIFIFVVGFAYICLLLLNQSLCQ